MASEGIDELVTAGRLTDERAGLLRRQLAELDVHRAVAVARLERIARMRETPPSMRHAISKARNGLRDHAKANDLVGAMRDVAGSPVVKRGKAYNHLDEVQEMMKSIDKAGDRLRDAILRNAGAWTDHQNKLQEAKGVLRDIRKDITNVTGIMPRKR